jgi:hypothetical protein
LFSTGQKQPVGETPKLLFFEMDIRMT